MAINPLKILTYLTASKDARFEETVNISGAVTAQNGVTVSGGNLNVSAGNISGSGTLQAGGAATLANGLTVTGAPVNAATVDVSASALDVANLANVGSLNVEGNATIVGDLTVKGTYTYIQSSVVTVGDLNLNLGTGSNTPSALDGGGLDLGSSSIADPAVQWRYDNANTAWTSNVDINLKTDTEQYKISGSQVLTKTGTVLEVGAGVDTVMVANGNELAVSGTLQLSGTSDFTYITGTLRNAGGLYDVDEAIHELDTKLSASATANTSGLTTLKAQYSKLRTVVTGTFTTGQATVILTSYDATEFAVGQIDNIALDIMVDSGSTGRYTNDLVAMELFTSGSDLKVQIDAPATPSGKYRLIAVNERDGGLG